MLSDEPILDVVHRWRRRATTDEDAVRAAAADLVVRGAANPEVVTVCGAVIDAKVGEVGARLGGLEALADDPTPLEEVVAALAGAGSLGVVSHGPLTTDVLIGLLRMADDLLSVMTDRPSVARSLDGLGIQAIEADPARADRLLLPAVAVHRSRVWSSAPILEVAARATAIDPTAVVVHAKPLAHLDDAARLRFRSPAWATDADDERWSFPFRPGSESVRRR